MGDSNGHGDINLDWINIDLFETILVQDLNLNKSEFSLEIKSIKPAIGNGEHYLAEVTRVQVALTMKNEKNSEPKFYSFIVKSMGDNKDVAKWVEKEVLFYSDIVPKLIEMKPAEQYIPKNYPTSNELKERFKSVIVEDLSPYGYKMLDRLEGLDLEHCKLFYKKLGGYHALTAACYEKNGSFGPIFHKSNYNKEVTLHSKALNAMFPPFVDIFTKYDSLKPYHEKVKNWKPTILQKIQAVTEPNPNEFNVLCHGDSWTNNLLYLHDENSKPKDMIFIDHQLAAFGTPILDIFFFFVTSAMPEVRTNHFDELIQIYHDSLMVNLAKYGYPRNKIPTLRNLHMTILKCGSIACFLTMGMMAVCLVAADKTGPIHIGLSDTKAGRKIRYNFFNSPRYLKNVESVMKFLDYRGLLEF